MLSYIVLAAFLMALFICLFTNHSLIYALLFGLICFVAYGRYQKISFARIGRLLTQGISKSKNILVIFVLIGIMTALWRACGTIPFIVYYGLQIINPKFFVVSVFLLCCAVSFLLGTSFGTASTVGVIAMILARINNIDPVLTGGAVISGIFFGDRCSPMSSSASLVATLTNTNLYDNIKTMFRTAFVPLIATLLLYQFLGGGSESFQFGGDLIEDFPRLFSLHWIVSLPAVIILALAVFKLNVKIIMGVSIAVSLVLCLWIQSLPLSAILPLIVSGYTSSSDSPLIPMISGGGLLSMLNVGMIVCISSSYFGILQETGLLSDIQNGIRMAAKRLGRFTATLLAGVITSIFSCNQTLATMLSYELCRGNYQITDDNPDEAKALAIDLEDTVILVAALVPWSIAGSAPLASIGANASSLIWAFYLYLVPLWQIAVHTLAQRKQQKRS